METKKNRKNGQKNTSDQHTNSQDCGKNSAQSVRRSSRRIQNMRQSTASPEQFTSADSAYDADEESVTPNSSPNQQTEPGRDPYEMDMTDDEAPAMKNKQKRKNDQRKSNKQFAIKTQKKAKSSSADKKKNNPTSTPVLHSCDDVVSKLHNSSQSLSVTPEVTPILPYKPHECASLSDESFTTPQIHRPSKKRSLQPDALTNLSTQLSYNTPGDSGIALSPVSKKHRSTSDTEKHTVVLESRTSVVQKRSSVILKTKKEHKHTSNAFEHLQINKIFSPITEINIPDQHKRVKVHKKTKTEEDSCFGFDSLMSPLIATENSPPPKPKRLKNSKKLKKSISSKETYRLKLTNSSDSSTTCVTSKPRLNLDSGNSPENLPRTKSSSPTLFSDSFSADSESLEMEVNKSSIRTYKSSKLRQIKVKENVSKLDVWATNFNMEIEDIEKFDLNIE